MIDCKYVGLNWFVDQVEGLTEYIEYKGPVAYCEENRYLPSSTTSKPGPIDYDINPYMKEIVECFSMRSPVRDVSLMKGVQLTYTVSVLESILFYFITYLKTYPTMLVSADKELVSQRIENNILPMLQHSGYDDVIQSQDLGNQRKTGKTDKLIQWKGGGFMVPIGGQNASKMRSHSILLLLQDEIDSWPLVVGRDGDPDKLTRARTNAFENKKILCGSTPTEKDTSKIYKRYLLGDQRHYFVKCKHCGEMQYLEWRGRRDDEKEYGIAYDHDNGQLISGSVRYICKHCLGEHYEYDKADMFDPANGAEWRPTAKGIDQFTRSYFLPAFYSPIGFFSWEDCVKEFFECYDVVGNKVKDIAKYQVWYNNVRGEPFEVIGDRVQFTHVSSHRRAAYSLGEIPNIYAMEFAGSEVLFVVCTVDMHKDHLYVATTGVCRGGRTFLIDYYLIHGDNCCDIDDPAWGELALFIEEKRYRSDNNREYGIFATFIDASYESDTVKTFTEQYMHSMVFPIMGAKEVGKNSTSFKEFRERKLQSGKVMYDVKVDHYKDRLAVALRRMWIEEKGQLQNLYHFNAPVNIADKKLKELTAETKRKETDKRGNIKYVWHRPSGSRNELWDLTVYAHAGVDIIAYLICRCHFDLDTVEWVKFWSFMEEQLEETNPVIND